MKTQRRRRKEGKTDYGARLALLKSGKTRVVIRKSNRYLLVQLVESDNAQDNVIARVSSEDLFGKGWPKERAGSLKSLAAAYLTGFMLGKKFKGKIKEAVLDIGLQRNVGGSRIYATLKGILDAGLNVVHNPEALPSMERIKENKKISETFEKIKESLGK
ncbi:50S ribosomal protein L18 [Candidatus Pacearchaeota archaeon]|nr:50S ribosomal protein L18 [Candidatus Pacearchaeota archaeon]